MEIQKWSDGKGYIIGPLSNHACDGVGIKSAGDGRYRLQTFESRAGRFDPNEAYMYKDYGQNRDPGQTVIVFITDEEMEALFLAWQLLKRGK